MNLHLDLSEVAESHRIVSAQRPLAPMPNFVLTPDEELGETGSMQVWFVADDGETFVHVTPEGRIVEQAEILPCHFITS